MPEPEDDPLTPSAISLTQQGYDALIAALDAPPAVIPELLEVLRRRPRWETPEQK